MRASFHYVEPGEPDPELLGLAASAGTLAWGSAWIGCGFPLPQCVFHIVTGCPCPTCGATRCISALLHGHIGQALGWNPLVFVALAVIALLNLYAATVIVAGLPRVRLFFSGNEARFLQVACVFLMAANWMYEIHRGV